MLPDSVRTSSELLQPSISHPSLSTHIFSLERSSAEKSQKERHRERERDRYTQGGRERETERKKKIVEEGAAICDFSGEINRGVTVVLKC